MGTNYVLEEHFLWQEMIPLIILQNIMARLESLGSGTDGWISCIAEYKNELYVGGNFILLVA